MLKLLLSALAGAVLGILCSRYLFVGSWLSLIPWAIVGLALGFWSGGRTAWVNGAAYGFILSFLFMLAGYAGSAPLVSRLPFFALLGIFGAICGAALGLIGAYARKLTLGRKSRAG